MRKSIRIVEDSWKGVKPKGARPEPFKSRASYALSRPYADHHAPLRINSRQHHNNESTSPTPSAPRPMARGVSAVDVAAVRMGAVTGGAPGVGVAVSGRWSVFPVGCTPFTCAVLLLLPVVVWPRPRPLARWCLLGVDGGPVCGIGLLLASMVGVFVTCQVAPPLVARAYD